MCTEQGKFIRRGGRVQSGGARDPIRYGYFRALNGGGRVAAGRGAVRRGALGNPAYPRLSGHLRQPGHKRAR